MRAEAEATANLACFWFCFVSRVLDLRLRQEITPTTAEGLNLFLDLDAVAGERGSGDSGMRRRERSSGGGLRVCGGG